MLKPYIQSAILGVIAVLVLNGFLVFAYMSPLLAFLIKDSYILLSNVILGAGLGSFLMYLRRSSNVNETFNPSLDLRFVLSLLVFAMFITYVASLGSFLTCYPLVIYSLYVLSMAASLSSMSVFGEGSSTRLKQCLFFLSAMLLGGGTAGLFWYLVDTWFFLANPLISSGLLWITVGIYIQLFLLIFVCDLRVNLASQWMIGIFGIGIAILALSMQFQPYLSLVLFVAVPVFYAVMRLMFCELNDDKLTWHPKLELKTSSLLTAENLHELKDKFTDANGKLLFTDANGKSLSDVEKQSEHGSEVNSHSSS